MGGSEEARRRVQKTYLARKVELSVEGLDILQRIAGNQLLVQPDLMICGRAREKVLADPLREFVRLVVQF